MKILKSILFILIVNQCFSNINKDSTLNIRDDKFLGINAGASYTGFRDYGTSPLFYSGIFPAVKLDFLYYKNNNIFHVKLSSLNGVYTLSTDDAIYSGTGNSLQLDLTYFRKMNFCGSTAISHYFGGTVGNYSEIRNNDAFMNASFVFDNFTRLDANYKFEYLIIKKEKEKKFFKKKYISKEKHYLVSVELGLPLYTLVYRPGFSYIGNSTSYDQKRFQGYEFGSRFFPGLNTDISFSRILKNGNRIKLSYYWDMFTTGKASYYKLNSSKHIVLLSLIFKLN